MEATERIYVITLKKKVIDIREKSSKINEILKLVGNVGFYVWYDDETDPNNLNPIFLNTRIGKSVIARYKVSAIGPVEAIEKILKEHDKERLAVKSGALMISLDRIMEVPLCEHLRENDNMFFCVSKSNNVLCVSERQDLQNCILAYKDEEGILQFSSEVKFIEETVEVEKQSFTVLRSKSS